MSILTQSKLSDLMKSNKWKIWRIINSAVIFFSFFIPWAVMEGGVKDYSNALIFTGFRMLQFYEGLTMITAMDLEMDLPFRISSTFLLLHYLLGLITILIYCVLNMLVAIFRTKLADKPIWNMLIFCLLALGGMSLWYLPGLSHGAWQNLSSALWGYWLVLIGLVSSIVLEISYLLSKRT